jgi:hypothetical protein
MRAALLIAVLAGMAAPPASAAEQRFDDPFAYCAAVGTIDPPDARYVGPRGSDAIAKGLEVALGMTEDAPLEPFRERSTWRCMARKVYACTFGANLPCREKADISRTPTSGMSAFCRYNPSAGFVPIAVTGRATVYAWRCAGDTPAIQRQVTEPDASGYLADAWYEIARPEE